MHITYLWHWCLIIIRVEGTKQETRKLSWIVICMHMMYPQCKVPFGDMYLWAAAKSNYVCAHCPLLQYMHRITPHVNLLILVYILINLFIN